MPRRAELVLGAALLWLPRLKLKVVFELRCGNGSASCSRGPWPGTGGTQEDQALPEVLPDTLCRLEGMETEALGKEGRRSRGKQKVNESFSDLKVTFLRVCGERLF